MHAILGVKAGLGILIDDRYSIAPYAEHLMQVSNANAACRRQP
jgi:hypothetical protein